MPRKLTLKQRLHTGFILGMAFLLVLASNRLNRRNFSRVEQNVNTVFEDRVVAQDYIYQLNNLIHKKKLLVAESEWKGNEPTNANIEKLVADFAATKLTNDESIYFDRFKENYTKLISLENYIDENRDPLTMDSKEKLGIILEKISGNLDNLSKVQLTEGNLITQMSIKSLQMNQMLSRLEIAFLIIIGILFLVIIFNWEKSNMVLFEEGS